MGQDLVDELLLEAQHDRVILELGNGEEKVVSFSPYVAIGVFQRRVSRTVIDVLGRPPRVFLPFPFVEIVERPHLDLHDDVTLMRQLQHGL